MPAAQLHYCLLQIRLIVVIWQHLLLTWLEEMLLSEIQQVAHRPLADVTCQIWGGVCVFAVDFHKNSFLQLKQKDQAALIIQLTDLFIGRFSFAVGTTRLALK